MKRYRNIELDYGPNQFIVDEFEESLREQEFEEEEELDAVSALQASISEVSSVDENGNEEVIEESFTDESEAGEIFEINEEL